MNARSDPMSRDESVVNGQMGAYDPRNQYTTRKTAMQAIRQEFIKLLLPGIITVPKARNVSSR
jgi:hypothetical protein